MRIPLTLVNTAKMVKGNKKLGKSIWTWSIPAGVTCPGKTRLCASLCYADKNLFTIAFVLWRFLQNWVMACTPYFVDWIVAKIIKAKVKIVRIHVSGDLFSDMYTRQWIKIITRLPDVRFFIFTRSWTVKSIRPAIEDMVKLANVRVFYSIDRETGLPSHIPDKVRLAYLMTSETDLPPIATDLVFKDYGERATKSIRANGVLVCPAENGTSVPITCEQCRLCIDPLERRDPRKYKKDPLSNDRTTSSY